MDEWSESADDTAAGARARDPRPPEAGAPDEEAPDEASFAGTLRALAADRPAGARSSIALAAALVLGAAGWLLAWPAPIVERARAARVEGAGGVVTLTAAAAGRVIESRLRLGATVHAGEILLRLAPPPRLLAARRAAHAQAAALVAQAGALARQLTALAAAAAAADAASREAAGAADATADAAGGAAALAASRAARTAHLRALGLAPAAAAEQSQAEADARRLAAQAARASGRRQRWEDAAAASTRRASRADLARQLAALRGESAAAAAERWEAEIDATRLRAPSAGELGAVAQLPAGATVAAGDTLATLVPQAPLHLVADLDAAALGRVHPGQPARFWLAACPPAAACPGLPATVAAVAAEPRTGRLRIELALPTASPVSPPAPRAAPSAGAAPATPATAPASAADQGRDAGDRAAIGRLRHGMEIAVLEVEVGRAAPFALLLRGLDARARGADHGDSPRRAPAPTDLAPAPRPAADCTAHRGSSR